GLLLQDQLTPYPLLLILQQGIGRGQNPLEGISPATGPFPIYSCNQSPLCQGSSGSRAAGYDSLYYRLQVLDFRRFQEYGGPQFHVPFYKVGDFTVHLLDGELHLLGRITGKTGQEDADTLCSIFI